MNDTLIAHTILDMTSTSLLVPLGKLIEKLGSAGAERAQALRWITPSEEMPGWFQASPQQGVREEMRAVSEQIPAVAPSGPPGQQPQAYEVGDTVTTVVNGRLMTVLVSRVDGGKIEVQDELGKPVVADPAKLKLIQKGTPARPKSAMPVIPS